MIVSWLCRSRSMECTGSEIFSFRILVIISACRLEANWIVTLIHNMIHHEVQVIIHGALVHVHDLSVKHILALSQGLFGLPLHKQEKTWRFPDSSISRILRLVSATSTIFTIFRSCWNRMSSLDKPSMVFEITSPCNASSRAFYTRSLWASIRIFSTTLSSKSWI